MAAAPLRCAGARHAALPGARPSLAAWQRSRLLAVLPTANPPARVGGAPPARGDLRVRGKQLALDAPVLTDLVIQSTSGMGTLEMIAWQVALDIVLPVAALLALYWAIGAAARRAQEDINRRVTGNSNISDELSRGTTLVGLALMAIQGPASFLLPPLLVAYVFRTGLSIVDLLNVKYKAKLPALVNDVVKTLSGQLTTLESQLATVLSLSAVLFTTWFFINLKDTLIREVILVRAIRSGRKELERLLLPISTLVSWAAILACALNTCSILEINLKPLLAVGGAGGLAAGFASQQVLQNVVSGMNIFLSRPFVVGDQVVFSGGANIEGVVENVEIMRTLVKTSDGSIVAVPNKLVADVVVSNRTRALAERGNASGAQRTSSAAPLRRLVCFTVRLDRSAEERVDEVRAAVRAYLNRAAAAQLAAAGYVDAAASMEQVAAEVEAEAEAARSTLASMSEANGHGGAAAQAAAAAAAVAALATSAAEAAAMATSLAVMERPASPAGSPSSPSSPSSVTSTASLDDGSTARRRSRDQVQSLRVGIELNRLAEKHLDLFVRAEMLFNPDLGASAEDACMDAVLLGASRLVRDQFGGLVLWA